MEENKGLIIFEKAMNKRFLEMADIHGLEVFKTNLENNFHGNPIRNIVKRILSKSGLLIAVSEIESFITKKKLQTVYFSSSEGYVSHNIICRLKNRMPNIKYIALQHGVFPLKYSYKKEILRKFFNRIGMGIFGVYPIGAGFGGIRLNAYYVYSEREKNFLIEYRNWKNSQVYPKLEFIKADLLRQYENSKIKQDANTAIFLMQCLELAGLCSKEEEHKYITTTIRYLSNKYENVLLKPHPACVSQLDTLILSKNVVVVNDMVEGFKTCKNAYSFFSTALIDAKLFKLKTTGIEIKNIKVDKEIYNNFDIKLNFEDIISI